MTQQEQQRYAKQILLPELKLEGQQKLAAANVLVIGAGGLGCPVLQYLTAAGVGHIGIADGDIIDISNLQRQVLYTAGEVGQGKSDTAVQKMSALNPHVQFTVYPVFITAANALQIIKEYNIVVDCSDNFSTRYLVNDACIMLHKPFVSGAIYKFEGQISVFNYQGGPTYRCIFPQPPGAGESPNCADIGVIATLPGIVGSIQASEVIKMITGIGEVLSGRLLVIDTLTMVSRTFSFRLNNDNLNISELQGSDDQCTAPVSISYDRLTQLQQQNPTVQLVDVREMEEHFITNIGGINMPLSTFGESAKALDKDHTIILYCSSGVRSKHAAAQLAGMGFTKVMNLAGGIAHLTTH